MHNENPKVEYMLLFRGLHWEKNLSPEEIQQVMTRWVSWFDKLSEKGILKAGQPLAEEGKIVSGTGGQSVVDGPFAESKEAIAGYFLLEVEDLDQAVEIARQCPALEHGLQVEVRLVSRCCNAGHIAESLMSSLAD